MPPDAPQEAGGPPVIEAVEPWDGAPGDSVRISGREFDPTPGATLVTFGGVPSEGVRVSAQTIDLEVPLSAVNGRVRVTTPYGTTTSALYYVVTAPGESAPAITSAAPLGGPAGGTVAIRGLRFDPDPLANHVRFGEGLADVLSASDTLLSVAVPVTATVGPLTVTTSAGRATAPVPFVLHEESGECQTPTLVAGTLPGSLNFTRAGCPYVMLEEVRIPPGARVMVEEGVVIKFFGGDTRLVVEGELVALGTAAAPVVFTSYRDDAYAGDTDGDGAATSPAAGDWARIDFLPGSAGELEHLEVRYGGSGGLGALNLNGGVRVARAVLAHNAGYGLVAAAAPETTSVTACDFFGNDRPLLIHPSLPVDPALRLSPPGETPNAQDGIFLAQAATLPGETVWDATGWPYIILAQLGDVFVGGSSTLRIRPGVTVKLEGRSSNLVVLGELVAEGTAAQPIAFTSLRDDARGGDANGDGYATSPAPGDWDSIDLGRYSQCVLSQVEILYGGSWGGREDGAVVALAGCRADVSDARIASSAANGIMIFGGSGRLYQCDFVDNERWGVRLAEADAWYAWGGETLETANQFVGNGGTIDIGAPPGYPRTSRADAPADAASARWSAYPRK